MVWSQYLNEASLEYYLLNNSGIGFVLIVYGKWNFYFQIRSLYPVDVWHVGAYDLDNLSKEKRLLIY